MQSSNTTTIVKDAIFFIRKPPKNIIKIKNAPTEVDAQKTQTPIAAKQF
jgi:hypothetical protein